MSTILEPIVSNRVECLKNVKGDQVYFSVVVK